MAEEQRPSRWVRPRLLLATTTASIGLGGLWLANDLAARPTVVESGQSTEQDEGDHDRDHDHSSTLGADGRFTGPDEGWPPQPRDAVDVVDIPLPAESSDPLLRLAEIEAAVQAEGRSNAQAQSDRAVGADQLVLADRRTIDALGDQGRLVAVEQHNDKNDGANSIHLMFYSLATNRTVEAEVRDGRIVDHVVRPGSEFQPPLDTTEEATAVELARRYWRDQGESAVDRLEGYGILAFQPGGAHYDTRMAYVSFHADIDARPELITWVDLTRGEIFSAEVDR